MFGITLIESSWTTLIEIAVYIKSHINYRVRHNLINPDIEAIIIEIIYIYIYMLYIYIYIYIYMLVVLLYTP